MAELAQALGGMDRACLLGLAAAFWSLGYAVGRLAAGKNVAGRERNGL